jgi:hypothetical protein
MGVSSVTVVYLGIGSVLAVSVAILITAVLFLRTARRYVDLAEKRLELLREGQALMLEVARQQRHASEENQEPQRRERIPEVVGHPLGQRVGEEVGGSRRPEAPPDRPVREAPDVRGFSTAHGGREKTQKAGGSPPRDDAPRLGVKVSHPDDDVTLRGWNGSPAKFFQRCYDRYLEHYEGYVRLAERIHQMRDESEASAGTLVSREWEDKLRRAYEAIERTTQRLDILEEYYPELATDSDRISSRVGTASLHAGLVERFGRPG